MRSLLILALSFFIITCTPPKQDESIDRLVVRLKNDPDRVNPLLHATSISREVYQYVMLMMGEQNPKTLEFDPLLIKELPKAVEIEEGLDKGKYAYNFELLPDVTWTDGSPVTAEDYLFTLKLIYHKGLNLAGYKAVYSKIINSFTIDDSNPKKFTIITSQPDENDVITLCGVEVYPIQYYDPNNVMLKYSLEDLLDESKYEEQV